MCCNALADDRLKIDRWRNAAGMRTNQMKTTLIDTKNGMKKGWQWVLFALISVAYMLWLLDTGSMTSSSGDAADCWHSITTWYSSERYGSYTL